MPTEITKLGGLLSALSNLCEDPLPPSPDKTYSANNIVEVATTQNANNQMMSHYFSNEIIDPLDPTVLAPSTTPAVAGIDNLAAIAGRISLPTRSTNNRVDNNLQRSNRKKPAPPPYPPPGYYITKEKFLDSDDSTIDEETDSDEDSEDSDSDEEEVEVQYFNSFESDDESAASSQERPMRGRPILPTKKNARARNRSLPSRLRPMPDEPPTRKYNKRKKSSLSTARPKLASSGRERGSGSFSSSTKTSNKKSKYDKSDAIPRPTPEDILAGRGGGTNRHEGNIRFRDEARRLRIIYKDEQTDRRTKYVISQELVTRVGQYNGRFLEKGHDGRWYEMDENSARKKASQVLREEKWDWVSYIDSVDSEECNAVDWNHPV